MTDDYLTKLIDDHWAYIEGILHAHALGDPDINLAKYHYKTAFRHGYKRAKEEVNAWVTVEPAPLRAKDLYP